MIQIQEINLLFASRPIPTKVPITKPIKTPTMVIRNVSLIPCIRSGITPIMYSIRNLTPYINMYVSYKSVIYDIILFFHIDMIVNLSINPQLTGASRSTLHKSHRMCHLLLEWLVHHRFHPEVQFL